MTITIRLPIKLESDLRTRLHRRGIGLSDFVRDAYDLGKSLFGRHGSGRRDLSSNRKAILKEMLRDKHPR